MRQLMLVIGLVPLALLAACPAAECRGLNDCGLDEICSREGTCIPEPPPGDGISEGEGEGEIPGEGEGEGEGELPVDEIVQTDTFMTMFVPAGGTTAHVALGLPGSGFDEVVPFDLRTGALGDPIFDFRGTDACAADTILELDEATLQLPDGDEVWFSCLSPQRPLQISFGDEFNLRFTPDNIDSAQLSRLIPVNDGTAAGSTARLLVAARGGTALQEVQLNPADQLQVPRVVNDLGAQAGVDFTAIMALYVVAEDDPTFGDIVLVYDRGTTPRLVPLQRAPSSETWIAPPLDGSDLDILELPADTHFAFFRENIGIPDLGGLSVDSTEEEIANVVLTRPTLDDGTITFLRYELEQRVAGSSNFNPLLLQASDPGDIRIPANDERVLFLERTVNGQTEYVYALTNSSHIWSFPLHVERNDDRRDDVLRAQFNNPSDQPVGVIPFPGNPGFLWMAAANRQIIELLELNESR